MSVVCIDAKGVRGLMHKPEFFTRSAAFKRKKTVYSFIQSCGIDLSRVFVLFVYAWVKAHSLGPGPCVFCLWIGLQACSCSAGVLREYVYMCVHVLTRVSTIKQTYLVACIPVKHTCSMTQFC